MLTQGKYTRDLLKKNNMLECTPNNTPMSVSIPNIKHDHDCVDNKKFRSIVGSLQYLSVTSGISR